MKPGRKQGQKGAMPVVKNGIATLKPYLRYVVAENPVLHKFFLECSGTSGEANRQILKAVNLMLSQDEIYAIVVENRILTEKLLDIVKNGIQVNASGQAEIKPEANGDFIKLQQEFLS